MLAAHVISGCDTVSTLYGIGKGTVLKILKSRNKTLNKLGNTEEPFGEVMQQCTAFISSCYGYPNENDMSSLRYRVWTNKTANHKLNSAPHLRVLPPTTEAFEQHVYRTHLQLAIFRSALHPDPPDLNPVDYGYYMNADTKRLELIGIPVNVSPAPESVLNMIKCGCSSSTPCSTSRCSCYAARLSCSVFCSCHGDSNCKNPETNCSVRVDQTEDYDESVECDVETIEVELFDNE